MGCRDSRRAGLIPRQKVPGLRDRRQDVRRRYQGRPVTVAPATPGLIGRGDLLAALDRAVVSKVTIISAPAGSGKTSLVRAWADRPGQPRRLAMVQVQRDQHDAWPRARCWVPPPCSSMAPCTAAATSRPPCWRHWPRRALRKPTGSGQRANHRHPVTAFHLAGREPGSVAVRGHARPPSGRNCHAQRGGDDRVRTA
jgi:hypothetical protein